MEPDFYLGDTVRIACSGESGEVIGQAFFLQKNSQLLVRYRAADGRAVEAWWDDYALELVSRGGV